MTKIVRVYYFTFLFCFVLRDGALEVAVARVAVVPAATLGRDRLPCRRPAHRWLLHQNNPEVCHQKNSKIRKSQIRLILNSFGIGAIDTPFYHFLSNSLT